MFEIFMQIRYRACICHEFKTLGLKACEANKSRREKETGILNDHKRRHKHANYIQTNFISAAIQMRIFNCMH